jgi:hypothetical protein
LEPQQRETLQIVQACALDTSSNLCECAAAAVNGERVACGQRQEVGQGCKASFKVAQALLKDWSSD